MRALVLLAVLGGCSVSDISFHDPASGDDGGGDDTQAPEIVSRTPDEAATGIEPTTMITVTFSEPIDATAKIDVADSKGMLDGTIEVVDRTLTFHPTSVLRNPEHVTLTLHDIQDASGNAMTDASWAFDTRAKAWQTKKLLENQNTGGVQNADLVVNPDGTALVAYVIGTGTGQDLYVVTYAPTTGWTAPLSIENKTGNSVLPKVCADAGGNALVIWRQEEANAIQIWANRFVVGTGWAGPVRIDNRTTNTVNEVLLACRPDGNAMAVWKEPTVTSVLNAARYVNGAGWSPAQVVPNSGSINGLVRSLATPTGGLNQEVFRVPWTETASSPYKVRTAQWFSSWGVTDTATEAAATLYDVIAAGLNDGSVMTLYTRSGGLQSVRNGNALPVETVSTSIPVLAAGTGANAVAAYATSPNFTMYVKRWNGSAWGAASSPDTAFRLPTDAAFTADGTIHVTFLTQSGSTQNTSVITQSSAGTWTMPIQLNDASSTSAPVRIAADPDGNTTLIYLADMASRRDLWVIQYR